MGKITMKKRGNALIAESDAAFDALAKIKDGREIMVEAKAARNPRHHRLYWKLIQIVCDSGAWSGGSDALHYWVKLRTGNFVKITDHKGNTLWVPKSIAFESMGQDAFARFFDRAVKILMMEVCGNNNWEDVRDEIVNMMEYGGRVA